MISDNKVSRIFSVWERPDKTGGKQGSDVEGEVGEESVVSLEFVCFIVHNGVFLCFLQIWHHSDRDCRI